VINSFSKFFGMTGWRVGWLVVPEEFCMTVEKLAQNIFISTPSHSQYAALASFQADNLDELESRRAEYERRGEFLYQQLQRLGFDCAAKPEGAFYIYANCRKFTDDSFGFARELLETEGVAVTPGKDFGDNDPEHYIRFAYTTDIDRLQEGVTRIERFITK
jgi:aspartate/methionine/tyrosine aminotransferase